MDNTREVLKIVVVGHVDHGKSTLIGRLLYDTNSLPEGAIEKVKRISKESGRPFEYAYLLDAFEEEQKQGITIDTTSLQFHTKKRDYVIIDAPGHVEFLKNMISGAANAEAALLLVDANEGIKEQSKRHGYILSLLGIRKVYVVVNKMDLVDYSQQRFEQIKADMGDFLNRIHIFPLKYIPVSAFLGENIASHSEKMPWYKGQPILDAIDAFPKGKELSDRPLRFPVQDVYKFDNRRIIAGRIESGTLKLDDTIKILPSGKTTTVKTIEHWAERDKTDTVSSGMSVGITVSDEFFNPRGSVIVHPDNAAHVADVFEANIFWMGKKPLEKGNHYKLKLATQETECEIANIKQVVDTNTLGSTENAQAVATNGVAEITVKTKIPVVFDLFKNNHVMGRFVLVDGYNVSGGGIIAGEAEEALTDSIFSIGDTRMDIHLFDEYSYSPEKGQVCRHVSNVCAYGEDDILPLEGRSYHYPADFDVVNTQQKKFAQIRGSRLESVGILSDYKYSGLPLVNSEGFALLVKSDSEWQEFKGTDADDANRWFDFNKYRNVRFEGIKTA